MDIDEFLDRELADLGSDFKEEKSAEEQPKLAESIKPGLSYGSLEEAEQSYMQLWHALAQQKLEWNNGIYEQLNSLSIRISGMLRQAHEEAKRKSSQIMELISRGRISMKEGKKDMPLKIYAQIQEISSSMPNIFFEEKRKVQEQVMDYYREITGANDAELIKKVEALAQEVAQLTDKIIFYMRSNDIANASSSYEKCLQLYNQIPEGFMLRKSLAGIRLLDIYKNLSIQAQIANLQKQLGQQPQEGYVLQPRTLQPAIPAAEYRKPAEQKYYAPKARYAPVQKTQQKKPAREIPAGRPTLERKREQAKKNIKKGFYNEAWKNIEEALQIEPKDAEAKALKAKIKTLQ